MGRAARQWAAKAEPHFGFLVAHGFDRVETDDSSFWSIWVQYASDRAAVQISQSNEFRRAEVHLIRLVEGKVPAYPIWITSDRIDWMLLDTVLEARMPSRLPEAHSMTGLSAKDLDKQLAFWSEILRSVAPDFLAGQFAAMDEGAEIIRARVREHPQQITTWLPDDAPPEADQAARRESAATVPPEVAVRVRRYRRGSAKADGPARPSRGPRSWRGHAGK